MLQLRDPNALVQSILTAGTPFENLDPKQFGYSNLSKPQFLGLLATDPGTSRTPLGQSAERWIQTTGPQWYTNQGYSHPSAVWAAGSPLPTTGTSLLGQQYALGAEKPVTRTPPVVEQPLPRNMAEVATLAGQNGSVTQPTGLDYDSM